MTENHKATEDLSTAELLKRITEQVRHLIQEELKLARAELTEKGKRAGVGAGLFGAAGLAALYGSGALIAAIILALAEAMPAWASALIVAVVLLATAAGMAFVGRSQTQKAIPPVPEQTVEEVKKDVETIKESTHH